MNHIAFVEIGHLYVDEPSYQGMVNPDQQFQQLGLVDASSSLHWREEPATGPDRVAKPGELVLTAIEVPAHVCVLVAIILRSVGV